VEAAAGILIINSQPPGAAVSIDGTPTGKKTPFAENLPPGPHQVVLALEGFAKAAFDVPVTGGEQARREVALVEAWGWLSFDVRPTARISLDGQYILDTPYAKPFRVRAGKHTLTIVNEALQVNKSLTVELADGETVPVKEVLK
jgi:hypothetical protein